MTATGEKAYLTGWDFAKVAAFDRGSEEVLVIERPPIPGVAEAVKSAPTGGWRGRATVTRAALVPRIALSELRIVCEPLAADIAALIRCFLEQFEVESAAVRVELVDDVSCPKFHCDNVRVRLVTTYHGPGTEYAPADRLDRVCRAPSGALVFLKGHKHPTYADRTLHRSPHVPEGEKRLCVVLDI